MNAFIRALLALLMVVPAAPPLSPDKAAAVSALQALAQAQQTDMIHHRVADLSRLYAENPSAQAALHVSERRSEYLSQWAHLRHIDWTGVTVTVRAPEIDNAGRETYEFYALERERYKYHYRSQPRKALAFGIASRHYITISKVDGTWKFLGDDFTNPVLAHTISGQTVPNLYGGRPPKGRWGPRRMAAVAYANHYCGDAPGCGNHNEYNKDYFNYNNSGGDCTNFISQVLLAGGIPMTGGWHYDHAAEQGSHAWINAPGLAAFLQYSGHATLVAKGNFAAISRHTKAFPNGAIETLWPGDVLSYQKGTAPIVHSAVVVGYDPKGVPLTDTHYNDRYRVPFDFGWPDNTTYYLWHVRYPGEADPPHGALP